MKIEFWSIKTTIGPYVGTCFTLRNFRTTHIFEFDYKFEMAKKYNMRIHTHNPGEEFWFFLDIFPFEMPTYYLRTARDPTIAYYDLKLKKSIHVRKSSKERPCTNDFSGNNYANCIISKVTTNITINKLLTCSTGLNKLSFFCMFSKICLQNQRSI